MVIDGGLLEHFLDGINFFHSVTDVEEVKHELANGSTVKSMHKDNVLADTGNMIFVLITVYFIPILQINLLFRSNLDEYGITSLIF